MRIIKRILLLLLAFMFLAFLDFLVLRVVNRLDNLYLQSFLIAFVNGIVVFLFARFHRKKQ